VLADFTAKTGLKGPVRLCLFPKKLKAFWPY
jgi:hypothetical protein